MVSLGSEVDTRRANRRIALLKRRVAILERMGLLGDGLPGVAFARATSIEDLDGAYRLVHDAFVEEGYMHPNPTGLRMRVYEALPETATFVARYNGEVIGVSGLVTDSADLGLPSDHVFGREIDALRGRGRVVCEITDQAVSLAWRRTTVAVELMQCMYAHAMAFGCTDLVFAVSPGHAKFYEFIGFTRVGEVRSYSKHIDDPVVLVHGSNVCHRFDGVAADDDDTEGFLRKYYVDENRYRQYVRTWQVLAERLFADPTVLFELFVARSGLLETCRMSELDAIRGRWGADVFDQVWALVSQEAAQLGAA